MTGNAALITDGGWCVGPDGAARTLDGAGQAPCGCGPTYPCCSGGTLCAPPSVVPGSVNLSGVTLDEVLTRTDANGNPRPPIETHLSATIDIGCGTFIWQPLVNAFFNRSEGMHNLPPSPGLKPWVRVEVRGPQLADQATLYWRPEATWWTFRSATPSNPSEGLATFAGTISQCGRTAMFRRDIVVGLETSRTVLNVALDGTLDPCSGSDCADCDNSDLEPA